MKTGIPSLQAFWDFSELEVDIEPNSLPPTTEQLGSTASGFLQRLTLNFSHRKLYYPAQAVCMIAANLIISSVIVDSCLFRFT